MYVPRLTSPLISRYEVSTMLCLSIFFRAILFYGNLMVTRVVAFVKVNLTVFCTFTNLNLGDKLINSQWWCKWRSKLQNIKFIRIVTDENKCFNYWFMGIKSNFQWFWIWKQKKLNGEVCLNPFFGIQSTFLIFIYRFTLFTFNSRWQLQFIICTKSFTTPSILIVSLHLICFPLRKLKKQKYDDSL